MKISFAIIALFVGVALAPPAHAKHMTRSATTIEAVKMKLALTTYTPEGYAPIGKELARAERAFKRKQKKTCEYRANRALKMASGEPL
jgi:hypothetical protein